MGDSGPRLLWAERTGLQLGPTQVSQLEMAFGLRFIGLSRAQESIVGHRVLRSTADGATILRVRRNFDAPGFTFELVSSIKSEDVRNWKATQEQLRNELGRLENDATSDSQATVGRQEISSRTESQMADIALTGPFLAPANLQLPSTIEGIRYTAEYILESMGEKLAGEIGEIDQRLAVLQVRLDAAQHRSAPGRRQRNADGILHQMEKYSRDESLEALPTAGAFALLAATAWILYAILKVTILTPAAIFAAMGITAVLGSLAVVSGRMLRIARSDYSPGVAIGIGLGALAAFGIGSYLFYSIYTVGVPVPTIYSVVTTLGLAALAAVAYRNSKRRRQSVPGDPVDNMSVLEIREEIEVLRVRRKTTLRSYTAHAGATSAAARRQSALNLTGDRDAQDRADETWTTPKWMAWAQSQLDREDSDSGH